MNVDFILPHPIPTKPHDNIGGNVESFEPVALFIDSAIIRNWNKSFHAIQLASKKNKKRSIKIMKNLVI